MNSFFENREINTTSLIILLGFLYFITGVISLELLNGVHIVNLGIFAPEGIALGFALYFGKRVIPGIFLGQFLLAYLNGVDIFATLEISVANSLEALIAVMIFNHFKLNIKLEHLRDVLGIVLISVLILQVFSATLGSLALFTHGGLVSEDISKTLFSWWFGNVMAQVVFTPFLLLLFTHYKSLDFVDYILHGLAFGIYIFFLELLISNPLLLLMLNIPIIIYIAAYKGMIYGTLLSVILAVITSISIYMGISIFQADTLTDNIINYNLFVLVHALIVLIVGVLFDEKREYEKDLKARIEDEVNKNKEQQLMMLQQSRLAQMGEMISMIAHQWRQPLNNLSLVNQLLISKYKKGVLDDKSVNYFKTNSKKQIDLMSTTIDDFRDFFKSEKTKKEFDVKDSINNILEMTKPIYTGNEIKIDLQTDGESSYLTVGYPNALAQAILNIINNAKDALVENDDIDDKNIWITLYKKDGEINISILDNGGGIPDDIIKNVFDPYFSTKKEKNGTGLGLYMSKMIVEEQMDAHIDVVNELDGAKFTIYLKGTGDVNK